MPPESGVAGIAQRIAGARERLGLTKAELGRRVGVRWRKVHKWEEEGQLPESKILPALARGLEMTVDELLGVAAGMDPPFAAWGLFLKGVAAEGDALSELESRALRTIYWPTGTEPTVRGYWQALTMLRTGTKRREPPKEEA